MKKNIVANLLGVNIDLIDKSRLFEIIISSSFNKEKVIVGHVNIKAMNIAYEDPKYFDYLKQCDWVTVDGFGVSLGLMLQGYKTSKLNRFTCPDYLNDLLNLLHVRNKSIYFLAGTPNVAEKMSLKLENEFPDLKAKCHHGFFRKEGIENDSVIEDINSFQPDVLYIGFGMPLQEFWLIDNYDRIDAHVFFPLGACLDFFTGTTYRGLNWFNNNGLEWLVRLLTEPKRLWRRYLIGNPKFLFRVIREKFELLLNMAMIVLVQLNV